MNEERFIVMRKINDGDVEYVTLLGQNRSGWCKYDANVGWYVWKRNHVTATKFDRETAVWFMGKFREIIEAMDGEPNTEVTFNIIDTVEKRGELTLKSFGV